MIKRAYNKQIIEDLDKKMVFISGPRQAGKTTLAKEFISQWKRLEYLNYDSIKDRKVFLDESWNRECDLVIFDEIHKHKDWKNRVKGIYDTEGNRPRILVTGSARLNIYRKGGDSLAGRFFHHRLYPLTYKEVSTHSGETEDILHFFLKLGNFPKPFLSQSEKSAKRWRKDYISLVTTQDIIQLSDLKDMSSLQLLIDMLRHRVGSPISLNSLAIDLQISPNTVKRYIEILEQVYLIFKVTPFHRNVARAILKEPKIYFYDIGLIIGDDGKKLENLTALHLLKHLHFIEDTQGLEVSLNYIRDKQGHEIDFCYQVEGAPPKLLEVKLSDEKPDKNLIYFKNRLNFMSEQIVLNLKRTLNHAEVKCLPVKDFFNGLSI